MSVAPPIHARLDDEAPDWSGALAAADLRWDAAPHDLYDAPFLGNGGLGAYVTVEPGRVVVHLDHNDVRDHQGTGGPLWGDTRLAVGRLVLATPIGHDVVDARLRLERAELHLALVAASGVTVECTIWIAATADVLVIDHDGWICDAVVEPAPARPVREQLRPLERPAGLLDNPDAHRVDGGGAVTWVQPLVCGAGHATALVAGDDHVVVAVVAALPPTGKDLVEHRARDAALAADVEDLREAHRAWWASCYRRSFVDVPHPRLGPFYWVQVYKLASAVRRGRAVASTTGPWLARTPWPGVWWNLNVQLSYWLAITSGRGELDSLTTTLLEHSDQLFRNTDVVGAAGLRRVTQADLVGVDLLVHPGQPDAEVGNLLWAVHTALRFATVHGVEADVEPLLDLLVGAVRFHEAFVEVDDEGVAHLPTTHSPEYADARDANYDLALLTWGLRTLLARPSTPADDRARWTDLLARLTPPPADEHGLRIGADVALTSSHRHYSHLLWFHPLGLIDADEPEAADLLRRSLDHWLSMPGALEGYTFTGAASMYAQLGDGDAAERMLETLLDDFVTPNTMYREAGPVIETPLSAAQSLHDLLLSDVHGRIRVFPAVPSAWRDVRFDRLRVEGGHHVSARRVDGATRVIEVVAGSTGPVTVQCDLSDVVVDADGPVRTAPWARGTTVHVDLAAGGRLRVTPAARAS